MVLLATNKHFSHNDGPHPMDTRKKRALLVEKLSRLHSSVSSFSTSDEGYDQCLKRLLIFAENSEPESVKVLYKILCALPNVGRETKRETYFSFIEHFRSDLINLGFSADELEEDLNPNEQEVADLFVDENIGKNLRIVEYLNSTFFTESQKSSLRKSRILIDLIILNFLSTKTSTLQTSPNLDKNIEYFLFCFKDFSIDPRLDLVTLIPSIDKISSSGLIPDL